MYYKAAQKYYYIETQPTAIDYIENGQVLDMWHYDENDDKQLWTINITNCVENKTFGYSLSEVELSDTYWAMLQEAKSQGILGMLFDNDQEQIDMVTSSANKEEYESKLATYYAEIATALSISFSEGSATMQQSGGSVSLDYIEVDNEVYYVLQKTKAFNYDAATGNIYEEMVSEHFTIRHIYTEIAE